MKASDTKDDCCAEEGIRRGLEDLASGQTRPGQDVFIDLRSELDWHRPADEEPNNDRVSRVIDDQEPD